MEVAGVPPGRPSRTSSGTRTTGWGTLLYANTETKNNFFPSFFLR